MSNGHIINMMQDVLDTPYKDMTLYLTPGYCARNLGDDYLLWECESCALVNYGRDCHNNQLWYQ